MEIPTDIYDYFNESSEVSTASSSTKMSQQIHYFTESFQSLSPMHDSVPLDIMDLLPMETTGLASSQLPSVESLECAMSEGNNEGEAELLYFVTVGGEYSSTSAEFSVYTSREGVKVDPSRKGDTYESSSVLSATDTKNVKITESRAKCSSQQSKSRKKRENNLKLPSKDEKSSPKQSRNKRNSWLYEIQLPFQERDKEKKRICAIRAKKHRDLRKERIKGLEKQIADITIDTHIQRRKNEELRLKVDTLQRELEAYQTYFGTQHFSTEFTVTNPQNILITEH